MSLVYWSALNGNTKNNGLKTISMKSIDSTSVLTGVGKITTNCFYNNSATSGGYVSNEALILGQNQSMFCWVKVTSFNTASNLTGILSCHRYQANSGMGITMKTASTTSGYLSVNTGNGSARTYVTYIGTTLLQVNTWYHVGYTYDGSKIRLYVNGNLDKEYDFTGMYVPADYLQIGTWSFANATGNAVYANYKLNGFINDVRVYNHTLSLKEIKEISKGLALHYDFEDSDAEVFDCSGFGNNGNPGSAFTVETGSAIGNYCGVFNGTANSAICCGTGAKLTDEITVNWWGYMDSWSSYGRSISCTEGGGWNFEPASSKMQWPIYLVGIGYKTCQSTMTLANLSSGWHMFTGTYDGYTSKIYVDGVFQNSVSSGTSAKTAIGYHATNAIFIGAEAAGSATTPTTPYFTGKIGDVKIFGKALSAEDILAEYNKKTSIDRNGKIFTGKFVEDEVINPSIASKNFLVSTTNFTEGYANTKIYGGYKQIEYLSNTNGAQYLEIPFIPDYGNGFKFEFGFSPTKGSSRYTFMSNYDKGTAQLSLELAADNKLRLWANTGGLNVYSSNTFIINNYNECSFEFKNNKYSIILNGTEVTGNYTYTGASTTDSMYMFLDKAKRTSTFPNPIKFYYARIWQEGNLLYDFIPCIRLRDNIYGMFDLVNNKFYYNLGTGNFKSALDYTNYQQAESITNSGTQCIDTGYIPSYTGSFKTEIEFSIPTQGKRYTLLSTYNNGNALSLEINANNYLRLYMNSGNLDTTLTTAITANTKHKAIFEFNYSTKVYKITLDNSSRSASYTNTTTEPTYSMYMFVDRALRYSVFNTPITIYSCKLYNGNNLIKDFIPAKRKSDNVIGIYDYVNQQFYTNIGTGVFTTNSIIDIPLNSIGCNEIEEL